MRSTKEIGKDIGLFFAWVAGCTLYFYLVVCGLIYTFHHWWVDYSGWYCQNITRRGHLVCAPTWNTNNIHWGFIVSLLSVIVITTILVIIIFDEE